MQNCDRARGRERPMPSADFAGGPHPVAAGTICKCGFSLTELLVVLAVIGILAGIATPLYFGYVATAREGVLLASMRQMHVFQEETRLLRGTYGAGTYDLSDPDNPVTTLSTAIGWRPPATDRNTYRVTVSADSYTITITTPDGTSLSRTFP